MGGQLPGQQTKAKSALPRSQPNAYVPPYRRLKPTAAPFVPCFQDGASAVSSTRRARSAAASTPSVSGVNATQKNKQNSQPQDPSSTISQPQMQMQAAPPTREEIEARA